MTSKTRLNIKIAIFSKTQAKIENFEKKKYKYKYRNFTGCLACERKKNDISNKHLKVSKPYEQFLFSKLRHLEFSQVANTPSSHWSLTAYPIHG